MKRIHMMLVIGLASSMLLFGCGKSTEETSSPGDVIVPEAEVIPDETPEEPEEVEEDVPPAEGMVRSKITNEWIPEEQASARPIAVMMPTDKAAQPQYGIGNADILYECMEEGDISRQLAIIDDWQSLDRIGNVRSCREYYLYMQCEWDPILIHFGGVFYMRNRITAGDIQNISGTYSDGTPETSAPGNAAFFRTSDKSSPHNAYVSAETITKAMDNLGYESEHRSEYYVADHFVFANGVNTLDVSDAVSAKEVDLSECYPVSKSSLTYNEEDGLYYKSLHGNKQIDAATGEQLTFANVIIQTTYWEYQADKKYLAFQMHDTTRTGYFVTQGKAIPIRWEKTSDYGPTKYYDMSGNEIELNTGKTYIAVVQEGREPEFK